MTTLERTVENRLIKLTYQAGGMTIKLTSQTGAPDRLIMLPGGKMFLVELKRPIGGRLSPLQEVWHKKARMVGITVVVLSSVEEVDLFMKDVTEDAL